MGGDKISDRRIDDIVEFTDGVEPVVDGLKEFNRVCDFPSGKRINPNKCFVKGGNLAWVTVPIQQIFWKKCLAFLSN